MTTTKALESMNECLFGGYLGCLTINKILIAFALTTIIMLVLIYLAYRFGKKEAPVK